ncbi:MAG: FAD-dependent oxidoreductase, partial [Firmicutes bacterium]|nr:FAD-dependent oxidoreductase [Bacillota bacterium]
MRQRIRPRIKMPKRDPQKRGCDFQEVALGLEPEMAVLEAQRCLQCKTQPCVSGCPVEVPIPEFIHLISIGQFEAAEAKIKEKNSLPAICGRVCPQESQCEERCILANVGEPVAIGMLERFAADYVRGLPDGSALSPRPSLKKKKERIAVIGSGPAGLSCAAELALDGYQVDVFEALHDTGGVLRYGIPEFRLPKAIVDEEVRYVQSLGVNIITNVAVGLTLDFLEMLRTQEYAAAFIATGAGLPYFLNIPGENLNGVYSANEFLTRANLMKAYLFPKYDTPIKVGRKVAVIGGGNVAMDAARTSLRLGSEK